MERTIQELKDAVKFHKTSLSQAIAELTERLEKKAYYDRLTGLLNRDGILQVLDECIENAKITGEQLYILMMDLNKFKEVNDTQGHDAGDILLQLVSNELISIMRSGDNIGRLGGDEFLVICRSRREDDSYQGLKVITDKIEKLFSTPFKGFEGFDISTSIGASIFPIHGMIPSILIKKADIAMYVAKDGMKAGSGKFSHTYTTTDNLIEEQI